MLRGVGHVHSTRSFDGHVPLPDLAALLRSRGLHFVLMSEHVETLDAAAVADHVAECADVSTDDFLVLPGLEIEDVNVLAYGIEAPPQWAAVEELVPVFRKQGAFLALSHPHKLHERAEDVAFPVIEGVEIWNAKYDGTRTARPRSLELYERLLADRPGLTAICGLDLHRAEDVTDVWMELGAERPTRDAVLTALRGGSVRIRAHGEILPIYADSDPGARRAYLRKSIAITAALDAATGANRGLAKAGIPVPRGVKKFVKKLF